MTLDVQVSQGEFLLYQTEDAQTHIQVRFVVRRMWALPRII